MAIVKTMTTEERLALIDEILNQPGYYTDTYDPAIHGTIEEWEEMADKKIEETERAMQYNFDISCSVENYRMKNISIDFYNASDIVYQSNNFEYV